MLQKLLFVLGALCVFIVPISARAEMIVFKTSKGEVVGMIGNPVNSAGVVQKPEDQKQVQNVQNKDGPEAYSGSLGAVNLEEVKKPRTWEMAEAYVGLGTFDYKKVEGDFLWGKGRLFLYNSKRFGIGPMVYFGRGSGKTADRYKFDYTEWAAGLSLKPRGKNWDASLDLGYGKHSDSGSVEVDRLSDDGWPVKGRWSSKSDPSIIYSSANLSLFQNRAAGKLWFPKFEANGTYIYYLKSKSHGKWDDYIDPKWSSSESKDEDEKDNWEVSGTAWVYDLWLNPNFRITPGLGAGLGSTTDDQDYWKYGISLEMVTRTWTPVQLSFEKHAGDQKGTVVSGWISLKY